VRYAWIREHHDEYPVVMMCRVLDVSRGGYYGWAGRKPGPQAIKRQQIKEAAQKYHARSHEIYGYRKVHKDILVDEGITCCPETVRRVMRQAGLHSVVKKKFVRTSDSRHSQPVAENVLGRDFIAVGPNQKWLADITYIRTKVDWLYLATVEDLFSRRIVGWSMSKEINAKLVQRALFMALDQRCPDSGLIHHSDRGVQYASDLFQGELRRHGIECSMSRKGNCWDNAPQESFFGKLKTEWIRNRSYETIEEARKEVFWYIEIFYNRVRRHASLGYVSPVQFEEQHEA